MTIVTCAPFFQPPEPDANRQLLCQGWQRKLSQLQVAQFPWDPKPDPQVASTTAAAAAVPAAAPAPVPAAPTPAPAANYAQAQISPQQNAQQLSLPIGTTHHASNDTQVKAEPGTAKNDAPIKQEPGLTSNGFNQARHNYQPNMGHGVAQQRAAQALENQYGQRAAASISAMHGHHPQGQMAQGRPGQPGQTQPINAQQYSQGVTTAMAAQQQRVQQGGANANGQGGLGHSQMDGTNDQFEGVVMERDANGNLVEMARVDIDSLLHAQIASRAKQMEGGGLMLPLKEATRHKSLTSKKKTGAVGPAQFDGPDAGIKEEDLDEDAINSDLDDTEDEQDEDDDDDENLGHIMLCMYDKVQRVKNKW